MSTTTDLPVTDAEVDADPAVAALEARIADGDTRVTAAQLAEERTAAAGRARFARLRNVFAARTATADAEQLEREQAAAALEHARGVLAPYGPAELLGSHEAAVDSLRRYAELLEARNSAVATLAGLPTAERVRGVVTGRTPWETRIPLDGATWRIVDAPTELHQALANARVLVLGGGRVQVESLPQHEGSMREPTLIAEARAQLDAA